VPRLVSRRDLRADRAVRRRERRAPLPARRIHRLRAGRLPGQERDPVSLNPESLSRTVSVETGQSGGGVEGAAPGAAAAPAGEASADSASGTLKESFSVQIRVDFADREQSVSHLDEKLGIAPEIAAIEDLVYPAPTESEASSDGTAPVRPARPRPTVLFVWGKDRVLGRIASLKIDESVYNDHHNGTLWSTRRSRYSARRTPQRPASVPRWTLRTAAARSLPACTTKDVLSGVKSPAAPEGMIDRKGDTSPPV
jgi:hypothetical protein